MGLAELTKEWLGIMPTRARDQLIQETMTTKFMDFKEAMTTKLTDFVQSQARALSLADLDRLIVDLPALRERFTKISAQPYPYLADQLEFLSSLGRGAGRWREPRSGRRAGGRSGVCAALLSVVNRSDSRLNPRFGSIGRRDDCQHGAGPPRTRFQANSYGYMLRWPEPKFDVDQLLEVISPVRVTSFCSSLANRPDRALTVAPTAEPSR